MREMRLFIILAILMGLVGLSGVELGQLAESLPGIGEFACFAMYGDYAVFGGGFHDLQVVDMSDIQNPEILSVLDFPYNNDLTYSHITIDGDKAYLSFGDNCAIVSLTDLRELVLLNIIDFGNATQSIAVRANVLYVGSLEGELTPYIRSFSVVDPLLPVQLDSLAIESSPVRILCSDENIVVYGWHYALVINTSNPQELQSLGYYGLENGEIAVDGHLMVSADGYEAQVFDLNHLADPPGTVNYYSCWPAKTFIRNGKFWFTYIWPDDDVRLMGIDISDPFNPAIIHDDYAGEGFNSSMMHSDNWLISKVSVGGNHAHRITFIADLDASPIPEFNASLEMWGINTLARADGLLLGMTPSRHIYVLELSSDGKVTRQRLSGDTFYHSMIRTQDGLIISILPLRIFDAQTGELLSTLALDDNWFCYDVIPAGDRLIIFAKGNAYNWYIIDISDPVQPTIAYQAQSVYEWHTGLVDGDILWMACWGYLHCYDISDITTPELLYEEMLWSDRYFFNPFRMLKIGEYIYLTTSQDVLVSVKVDETGLQEIATQDIPAYGSYSLVPFGEGMIIGGAYRLSVMSITDPLHPQEIATGAVAPTIENANGYDCIVVQDNIILVGTGKELITFDGELALMLLRNPTPVADSKLLVYPNPAVDKAKIICQLSREGEVRLELFNLKGQLVKSVVQSASEGYNLLSLNLQDDNGKKLVSGMYLLRVEENGRYRVNKFVVMP